MGKAIVNRRYKDFRLWKDSEGEGVPDMVAGLLNVSRQEAVELLDKSLQ